MQLPVLKIGNLLPRFPIIQGGMAVRVSTAPLVGAVAKAGGIGVIGGTGMTPEELAMEISQSRSLADGGIIGVNIMFAARQFKELVHTAIREKIDVIFTGAGFSREIFRWAKDSETPIVPIVSNSKGARLAEKLGAPAVVAEGFEAGGHLGTDRSVKEIVPEIIDTVSIPVVAAGGITSGFDMAEMIKLGAKGVQMATRFVLSKECSVADEFKKMYLNAREEDVVIIRSPVGLPGRALLNPFVNALKRDEAPEPDTCDVCLKDCSQEYCIMQALINAREGRVDEGVVFSGKNVFKIKEILSVQAIFDKLLAEFAAV
ncbi:MAG: nitronate monooxygenase [Syntrophomonadaceae bacterium]